MSKRKAEGDPEEQVRSKRAKPDTEEEEEEPETQVENESKSNGEEGEAVAGAGSGDDQPTEANDDEEDKNDGPPTVQAQDDFNKATQEQKLAVLWALAGANVFISGVHGSGKTGTGY